MSVENGNPTDITERLQPTTLGGHEGRMLTVEGGTLIGPETEENHRRNPEQMHPTSRELLLLSDQLLNARIAAQGLDQKKDFELAA